MRVAILLLPALFLLPLAAHASSGDCDSDGDPALGRVEIDTPAADPTNGGGSGHSNGVYYIDDRNYALGNGMWIYEETNGIWAPGASAYHNLQTGGSSNYVPDDNEVCWDTQDNPDQLLF